MAWQNTHWYYTRVVRESVQAVDNTFEDDGVTTSLLKSKTTHIRYLPIELVWARLFVSSFPGGISVKLQYDHTILFVGRLLFRYSRNGGLDLPCFLPGIYDMIRASGRCEACVWLTCSVFGAK